LKGRGRGPTEVGGREEREKKREGIGKVKKGKEKKNGDHPASSFGLKVALQRPPKKEPSITAAKAQYQNSSLIN